MSPQTATVTQLRRCFDVISLLQERRSFPQCDYNDDKARCGHGSFHFQLLAGAIAKLWRTTEIRLLEKSIDIPISDDRMPLGLRETEHSHWMGRWLLYG